MTRRGKGRHFVPVEQAPTGALSQRARELIALALCGFSLYALLCLASFRRGPVGEGPIPSDGLTNLGGQVGYHLAYGFDFVFGFAAWLPFLMLLCYAVLLFLHRRVERVVVKVVGGLMFTAMIALFLAGPDGGNGVTELTPWGGGGRFGANLSPRLTNAFGGPGRVLLLTFGAVVSLVIVTEWLFSVLVLRTWAALQRAWARLRGQTVAGALLPAGGPAALGLAGADRDAADDAEGAAGGRGSSRRRRGRAAAGADDADDDLLDIEVQFEPGAALTTEAADAVDGAEVDEDQAEAGDDADGDETGADGGILDEAADDEADEDAGADVAAAAAADDEEDDEDDEESGEATEPEAGAVLTPAAPKPKPKPRPKPKPKARPKPRAQAELPFAGPYPFPPNTLFREPLSQDQGATSETLTTNSEAIVQRLGSFGVQSEVVGVSVGPAVTQYELRLAEGIRVTKVTAFEPDLAAALKAMSVRVVAPIPGKDTIGIEVPNEERQMVVMRELLDQFGRAEDMAIPLFLGKDVAGCPIVEDLARMPHLLIAGTTGSGKSVCINTILLSILMTRTPAQVRMILIDPKMVELQAYGKVPHLCCDVVTNMKKAPSVLQWAVDEMENRYAALSAAGVNHIKSYNRLGEQELRRRLQKDVPADRVQLPYIVLVIDELADLMAVGRNEVEDSIQRLAQKSRAVGMHVILATQRPSTDVITGVIKANLPCQIAFKVNRRIDSRVILDQNGADKLLGHGDMLYVPPGGGSTVRAQGTFVGDDEIRAVTAFLEAEGQKPAFLPSLMQTQSSSRPSPAQEDPLFKEAVEVILGQQRGSATLLQRALSVGYTRATRLLELMEADGLVGPFVGSKSREVLLTLEEWHEREAAMAAELAALAAGEADADAAEDTADEAADDAEAAMVGDGGDPDGADGEAGSEAGDGPERA